MKKINVLTLFILLVFATMISNFCWAYYRDPFESVLPEEKKGRVKGKVLGPPPVTIEGVLWGSKMPQTIIDGEVYKEGDILKNQNNKLKDSEAKIVQIKENTVFILYGDKVHKLTTKWGG